MYLYKALNGLPGVSVVNNSPANEGDAVSIPMSRRSSGEGNCDLLQYCCLENPMDRGVWQATVDGDHERVGHYLPTKQHQQQSIKNSQLCHFFNIINMCYICCYTTAGSFDVKGVFIY